MTSGYLDNTLDFDEIFVRKGTLFSQIIPGKTLWTWGLDSDGELGTGIYNINKYSPVQTISNIAEWNDISSGYNHVGLIDKQNQLWMIGGNYHGQLGTNDRISRSSPTQVGTDTTWKSIVCANMCNVAIKIDGSLWTWGWNTSGQLGDNTTIYRSSPVQVGSGTDWKQASSGYQNTAAIKIDGTLWIWGEGGWGALGGGSEGNVYRSSPIQTMLGGNNWKQVAVGDQSVYAIKTDGTLWSWGNSDGGQLGLNDLNNRSIPSQVGSSTNWVKVAAAFNNFFAGGIKNDGTLWTWGDGWSGNLGTNSNISRSSPVQTIAGGMDWVDLSCGSYQTLAIKTDGSLWAWGDGYYGVLGYGGSGYKSSPIQIGTDMTWTKIASGEATTVGLR